MKKFLSCILCGALVAGILAGCGGKDDTAAGGDSGSAQLGLITGTGGLGDKNMNDASYEGLKTLEADGVKISVVEPDEKSDFANLETLYAETEEYEAIFCITYEQTDALAKVCPAVPGPEICPGGF